MDNFLKSSKLLLASILCIFSFSASASFTVPMIPAVHSPMDLESGVSLTPILQAGELQLVDETGNMAGPGTLKQSQWLLTKANEVSLVGGNTLGNAQREQVRGKLFNISSYGLNLSGESAASIFVNSKRLEVSSSMNELLGFIELPAFIYQADILDEFQAARVRFYNDGIVVQWHYGDASAAQPWELKIQATINNNEINTRFDSVGFNADFIAAYGNEEIKFSNKTTWYGHNLLTIYNTGNKAACQLPSSLSDCSTTDLSSGAVLYGMAFMAERNLTSDSNQLAITQTLETSTQYFWRARQAVDDGMGGNLYGDWSNFSAFTTIAEQRPPVPSGSDVQVSINAAGDYWGQKANSIFTITNVKGEALGNVTLKIEKPPHRKIISFPAQCSETETLVECLINSQGSEEQLEIGYEFTESYSEKSYFFQVCLEGVCGDYQYESFGGVYDLNMMTSYNAELTSPVDLSGSIQTQSVPFIATITNASDIAGQETLFKISSTSRVSVETPGCSIESREYTDSIICIKSLSSDEVMQVQFTSHANAMEGGSSPRHIYIETPCEFGRCEGANSIAHVTVFTGEGEKESSSGGALFFLPALLVLMRRRKILG